MFLTSPSEVQTPTVIETEDFDVQEQEQRLEQILSKINGVGDVSVMITTKTSTKNVYATDKNEDFSQKGEQIDQNTQTEYVLISPSNSTEQPIKIYAIFPEYMGVLVVCEGGDDAEVKLEVLQAIKSLCSISSESITILKMKE
ncbi:MAG: hypothetical protein R3Y09_08025 [Clostridia bacterium]